jgi:hypothetical protein
VEEDVMAGKQAPRWWQRITPEQNKEASMAKGNQKVGIAAEPKSRKIPAKNWSTDEGK